MCRRAYSEMKAKEAGVACADRSLKDAGLTKDERDALEWYRKQAEAGQKQQLEILKKNCNFP